MSRTYPAAKPPTPGHHKSRHRTTDEYLLTSVTATSYIGTILALNALSYLPRFDASGSVFGRWDAVHFFSIAERGYEYEQQVAFQPGWHALLHSASDVVASARSWLGYAPAMVSKAGGGRGLWVEGVTPSLGDIEIAAMAINLIMRIAASLALYRLTCTLFCRRTAVAAALLYANPPSPASALTYTEPTFAAAYFAGLLACSRRRWVAAALCFAAATSLRATGVFTAAVLGWSIVFAQPEPAVQPGSVPKRRSVPFTSYVCSAVSNPARTVARAAYAVPLALLVISPFVAFNTYLYTIACLGREWCNGALPVAYTAVQRLYWNIGLFHYWTPEQIPNLVIALPVLLPTFAGIWAHFTGSRLSLHSGKAHAAGTPTGIPQSSGSTTVHDVRSGAKIEETDDARERKRAEALKAATEAEAGKDAKEGKDGLREQQEVIRGPLTDAIYALSLFLALTLVFTSHTQIALRLAITDPTVWWTLALNAGMRRAWVWWCFLWAAVGLALWSGHYPPA